MVADGLVEWGAEGVSGGEVSPKAGRTASPQVGQGRGGWRCGRSHLAFARMSRGPPAAPPGCQLLLAFPPVSAC